MKRDAVWFAVYAPIDKADEVRTTLIDALQAKELPFDIDSDFETVECSECDSSHDCDCDEPGMFTKPTGNEFGMRQLTQGELRKETGQ